MEKRTRAERVSDRRKSAAAALTTDLAVKHAEALFDAVLRAGIERDTSAIENALNAMARRFDQTYALTVAGAVLFDIAMRVKFTKENNDGR